MTTTKIWECKIGEVDSVAGGSDYPMRQAVAAAYKAITGVEPVFIFSGWGASLTEYERAVVENRLPAPATAPEQQKQLDLSVFRMSWDYELSAMRKDPSGPYVCFSDLAYMLPATAPEQPKRWTLEQLQAARERADSYAEKLGFVSDVELPPAPSWQDAPTKPGMWACLYMGELSTAIFNAYEIEHFDASEMGGCRWQFIPDEDKP